MKRLTQMLDELKSGDAYMGMTFPSLLFFGLQPKPPL